MNNTQSVSQSYGIDVEEELTKMLSDELAKEIDNQILHEIVYVGVEERAEILIRECNINEILYDESYSNDDIINEINKKQSIPLNGQFLEKLNNYINEKRGTN
tara:strand:- start:5112 stop:5420 length:309 start_codon:yes stop_codon:yes gene_type:complete